MLKFILYLLIPLSSMVALPAKAKNCGSGIGIRWEVEGYPPSNYNSASGNDGRIMNIRAVIAGNMTCEPDWVENGYQYTNLQMTTNTGSDNLGQCVNNNAVSAGKPGLVWQLTGMSCSNGVITSDLVLHKPYDGQRFVWSAGTEIGKATLSIISEDFWKYIQALGAVTFPMPSTGFKLRGPGNSNINIVSSVGDTKTIMFTNIGTCSVNLSTNNIDFGKVSFYEINRTHVTRDFELQYTCNNRAAIPHGVSVFVQPERIINNAQGIFATQNKDGKNLQFELKTVDSSGNASVVPLAKPYQIYQGSATDVSGSRTFRVGIRPSTSLPTGKVSTFMNINLRYK